MEDTNDNPPVFEETVYSFDIPENAPRGYQVGEIVAKDADLGQNSQVSYAVVSNWANDIFSLNPQTGALTLTAKLDYEEVRSYDINIFRTSIKYYYLYRCSITFYMCKLKIMDNQVYQPQSLCIVMCSILTIMRHYSTP